MERGPEQIAPKVYPSNQTSIISWLERGLFARNWLILKRHQADENVIRLVYQARAKAPRKARRTRRRRLSRASSRSACESSARSPRQHRHPLRRSHPLRELSQASRTAPVRRLCRQVQPPRRPPYRLSCLQAKHSPFLPNWMLRICLIPRTRSRKLSAATRLTGTSQRAFAPDLGCL
jgi:hypothetical protein